MGCTGNEDDYYYDYEKDYKNENENGNENVEVIDRAENQRRINEIKIENYEFEKIYDSLCKVYKSLCLIKTPSKNGVGFLIRLNKGENPLYCLVSEENAISEEMLNKNEKIEVYYDNQQKKIDVNLEKSDRFIIKYKDLNATLIEIISEDKVDESYFLLPNLDYINDSKTLGQPKVFMPIILDDENISYYYGQIKESIENGFTHYEIVTIDTKGNTKQVPLEIKKECPSGSPIFIYDTSEVLALHKQGNKDELENIGYFIFPIIKLIQENIYFDKVNYGLNSYEGYFFNGKRDGNGKFIYDGGEYCYVGNWMNNYKHGKGTIYDKLGDIIYEGEFAKDKFEGKGKYIYKERDYYYVGEWLNNKEHGKGTIYYMDDKIQYEGDFVDGKFEGEGKFIYKDGTYYNGHWVKGLKNGKGTEYYKNGNIKYEGYFVNGKFHGDGKFIYEDGDYYIGKFTFGSKNGKGAEYNKDGTIKYKGIFANNSLKKKFNIKKV